MVALLFLFMMVNYADKAVLGLIAVPMMRDMKLSATQFGLIGSAFYLLYSLSGIGFGAITRYVKTRWLLTLLALIWAAVQFPMAAPVSFGTVIVCRVLLGLGEGPAYPVALHAAYKWFEDHKRNVPTTLIQIGAAVGVMVAAPALTYITDAYSWRAAFFALGVVGLIWVALWLALGAEGGQTRAQRSSATAVELDGVAGEVRFVSLLLDPTVVGVMLQWFLASLVTVIALAWGPVYMRLGLAYGAKAAGWIFGLQVAVQIPVGLALSVVSQHLIGRGVSTRVARGMFCSVCCLIGGLSYVALLTELPHGAKVALMTLGGSLIMQINSFGPQLIAEITPERQRGTLLAVVVSVAGMAGLIAPVLMGWVLDAMGGLHSNGYSIAFASIGALLIVAAALGMVLLDPGHSKLRLSALVPRGDAGTGTEAKALMDSETEIAGLP